MSQPLSPRLRIDLAGLERWAQMAPAYADECDWGWEHYAGNIRSILRELDREFETMQAELRKPVSSHVCSKCGSLIIGKIIEG